MKVTQSRWSMIGRLRRWWYLVTTGMWLGECAMDVRADDGALLMLLSGHVDHLMKWVEGHQPYLLTMHIWWHHREEPA